MKTKSKILVPLDGSSESSKAAAYAVKLAKLTNSNIIFLHVISTPGSLPLRDTFATANKYVYELTEKAEKWLGQMTNYAKREGVRTESDIEYESASVTNNIVEYADRYKIDLIVISKGKPKMKFLVGSVATAVVTRARCPILLVK